MTAAEDRARELAAEKFPLTGTPLDSYVAVDRETFRDGYVTGRTIPAAELETAAEAIALKGHNDGCFDEVREWEALEEWEREAYPGEHPGMAYEDRANAIAEARVVFESVGFTVESGE